MSALQNKSVLESFFDILKNEQNHWNLLLCCQWFWFFYSLRAHSTNTKKCTYKTSIGKKMFIKPVVMV